VCGFLGDKNAIGKNRKLFLAKGNNNSSSSRQTGAYSGVFARHGRLVDGVSNNCNPNWIQK